jgi:hypothetical protein
VTLWTAVYVPATGVKVGVAAAGKLMTYTAELVALLEKPGAVAIAVIVVLEPTLMGVEYWNVEPPTVVFGVVPFSV